MNVFTTVKKNVTTRQAAEKYGIHINHNNMAVCPFHGDKNPSMKVDNRFHCFGCQADGDAIDFTSALFSLPSREAAIKLANDFGLVYNQKYHPLPVRPKQREPTAEEVYQEDEKRCFEILVRYLRFLESLKQQYAAPPLTDTRVSKFFKAYQKTFEIDRLLDVLSYGSIEEKTSFVSDHKEALSRLDQWLDSHTSEKSEKEEIQIKLDEISTELSALKKCLTKNANDTTIRDFQKWLREMHWRELV